MQEEEANRNYKAPMTATANHITSSTNIKENKSILKSRNLVVDPAVESTEELRERPYITQASPQKSFYTKEEVRKTNAKSCYAGGASKTMEEINAGSLQRMRDVYEGKKEERKLPKGKQSSCPCERDGYVCRCCKERKLSEDRTKQPVGYYITFEQSQARVPNKKQVGIIKQCICKI